MSSPPKVPWDQLRNKNIELNQDINLAWEYARDVAKQENCSVRKGFEMGFPIVRELNEKIRAQERNTFLQENE